MKPITCLIITFSILSIVPSCKKKGCTYQEALNYDSEATKDDGSCRYPEIPLEEIITIPSSGTDVTLFSRWKYNDYELSTFSFKFGSREDNDQILNGWDLSFGNGLNMLNVNLVGGDDSRIADLGEVNFDEINTVPLSETYLEEAVAQLNHTYIVNTKNSDGDNFYSKFIIIDFEYDNHITFNWVRSDNGTSFN